MAHGELAHGSQWKAGDAMFKLKDFFKLVANFKLHDSFCYPQAWGGLSCNLSFFND